MNLDEYDSRVTLFSDEAFSHGINFNAKVCPSRDNDSINIDETTTVTCVAYILHCLSLANS